MDGIDVVGLDMFEKWSQALSKEVVRLTNLVEILLQLYFHCFY